ncbi:hypothetical protein HDU77_006077 [Chytriomyces hyalinus]|nr:hypothetical protein HDU77_006077 [Chytriomyces hyalinus]
MGNSKQAQIFVNAISIAAGLILVGMWLWLDAPLKSRLGASQQSDSSIASADFLHESAIARLENQLQNARALFDLNSTATTSLFDTHDIDLVQIQFLDFLNGEFLDARPSLFGGSLSNSSESNFNALSHWNAIISDAPSQTLSSNSTMNYVQVGRVARTLIIAHRILYDTSDTFQKLLSNVSTKSNNSDAKVDIKESLTRIIDTATDALFPWIPPTFTSIRSMQTSLDDSVGIVITGGNHHAHLMMHLISTLREEFNCTLPVELFYAGPDDLNTAHLKEFNQMTNVTTKDLHQYFPQETKRWQKFSAKPFAILASSFRTVLFMDADVLFFRDPREILENDVFRRNGLYYFKDRYYHDSAFQEGSFWFREINPYMSRYGRTLSYMHLRRTDAHGTVHQMDSGFIPLDKSRTGVLMSLLLACKMNSADERDEVLYKKSYGDKEAFWFSSEILRVPYEFNPYFGGTLGRKDRVQSFFSWRGIVCSSTLLQANEKGEPFWWNGGGILVDRFKPYDGEFVDFDAVGIDPVGHGTWWVWRHPMICMNTNWMNVRWLSRSHKQMLRRFEAIYRRKILAGNIE